MSKKELARLEVVQRVKGRQMRHAEAARQLSLSEHQVKRLGVPFARKSSHEYQGLGAMALG